MDKEIFDQLHRSMKEAVSIAKGELQTSRVFTVEPLGVKASDREPETAMKALHG